MPTYTFKLKSDGPGVEDDIGINLPNADMAYGYACDVIRELMRGREQRTQRWQLDVYHSAAKIFEIPRVEQWYSDVMETRPQAESVADLTKGVADGRITISEAVSMALVIGFQWNEKFEGTP